MKPRKFLLDGDSPHNFLLLNAISSSLPSNKRASTPCYFFGPYHSSTSITVLTLVSSLVLLSFVALYIWRCIVSSFSVNGDSGRSTPLRPTDPSSKGIHPSTIRSLPTISYGGDAEDMIDCVICLSEFQEGETVKLIPYCGHMFHPVCVDTWLLLHVTCPLCRSTQMHDAQEGRLPVRATEDDPSSIDQESLVVENCDTREEVAGDQVGAITWSP